MAYANTGAYYFDQYRNRGNAGSQFQYDQSQFSQQPQVAGQFIQRANVAEQFMPSMQAMAQRNIQPIQNPMPGAQMRTPKFSSGQVAGAIGGAAELAMGAIGQANQRLNINTNMGAIQNTPFDKPVYTGGQLGGDLARAKPQGATGGEIAKSTLSGATTGFSVGGPWGALIGGVVGAGASLIGGGVRKKRQRREKASGYAKLNAAQSQYNTADVNFRNRSAVQEDYQQQQDSQNRMYNLYRSQYS
jgi:uncharacterized protein involved in outer membrane biogenesis